MSQPIVEPLPSNAKDSLLNYQEDDYGDRDESEPENDDDTTGPDDYPLPASGPPASEND